MSSSIYLASQSPRRRELLEQIGIAYDVISVAVDECRAKGESPSDYVQRLSKDKAEAGAAIHRDRSVLGADTIVVLNEAVLEKPVSEQDAVDMLLRLSGTTHQVMTAVSIVGQHDTYSCLSTTSVRFRAIAKEEAQAYWQTGEPKDKAGGYGIQGLASVFVEQIQGSYSGVVGLPLFETAALLSELGIHPLRL